ncbi:hypothetical protein EDB86DRAFT_2835943 [Lactarius hatsudake]|nr:hypothetical protein EDB86DRAFT_2835943 [Lactarius hatsudake]
MSAWCRGRWWLGPCVTHGSWHVLGQGGGESAGGRVLCAMSGWRGGQWGLGLACRIEVAWQWWGRMEVVCFLQGLVHRVGVARWVGNGGVLGQDGGSSRAQMACNVQGFACHVGAAWQVGGGSVLGWG